MNPTAIVALPRGTIRLLPRARGGFIPITVEIAPGKFVAGVARQGEQGAAYDAVWTCEETAAACAMGLAHVAGG